MSKRTSGENPTSSVDRTHKIVQDNFDKLATRAVVPSAGELVPAISENMGSALVGAAIARMQGAYNDRLISFVEGTISQIHKLDEEIDRLQVTRKWLQLRVEAINAGQFTLSPRGIVFDNFILNEEGRG
jgi:hypothetical protein